MFIFDGFKMKNNQSTHIHKYASTQEGISTCAFVLLRTCVRVYLCSCFLVFASGCAQVKQIQNLEPLLTLKGYADEKDAQEKWVLKENENFNALALSVKDQSINRFKDKESIRQQFGDPVLIEELTENNNPIQRWLYRHPIQKLATDRVYLYFDSNDQLLRSEYIISSSDDQK